MRRLSDQCSSGLSSSLNKQIPALVSINGTFYGKSISVILTVFAFTKPFKKNL
jgi:hypothetical protein